MKRTLLLLCLIVGMGTPAEARSRLEYVDGVEPKDGIRMLRVQKCPVNMCRAKVKVYVPPPPPPPPPRGSLPPHSVMMCESGGNIRAENSTSTASGKWQIVDGTWNGFGGYSHAAHAPESVQDEKARQLWANGAGARHWKACL